MARKKPEIKTKTPEDLKQAELKKVQKELKNFEKLQGDEEKIKALIDEIPKLEKKAKQLEKSLSWKNIADYQVLLFAQESRGLLESIEKENKAFKRIQVYNSFSEIENLLEKTDRDRILQQKLYQNPTCAIQYSILSQDSKTFDFLVETHRPESKKYIKSVVIFIYPPEKKSSSITQEEIRNSSIIWYVLRIGERWYSTEIGTSPDFDLAKAASSIKNESLKPLKKYPEGITIENYTEENRKIQRVIVKRGGTAYEYRKVVHPYATFYFKDNEDITVGLFNDETKPLPGEKVEIIKP